MTARRRTKQENGKALAKAHLDTVSRSKENQKSGLDTKLEKAKKAQLVAEHLPPVLLVLTVLACSGALFILAFRDVFATGRNIAGPMDEAMLLFTKSTEFFDDAKGWKSQGGGLSSVKQTTTDANNMGGLFVRKVGGAAALTVQLQKILPLLLHPSGAQWSAGHFKPVFYTAIFGNIVNLALYATYFEDFSAAQADGLVKIMCALLVFESLVLLAYLLTTKSKILGEKKLPDGKTPSSVVSKIVSKTIIIVTGFFSVIMARDLLFPGQTIGFIPRDDIYLEWSGAFQHSPPEGSVEAEEDGMEAPLYVGDKFLSQSMALNMLILSLYKFVTAFLIKYGKDGSGEIKTKMIWRVQAIGESLVLFLFRIFTPSASSASLDLRWHLMLMGYEVFILALYAFIN